MWNVIHLEFLEELSHNRLSDRERCDHYFCRVLWMEFFKRTIDSIPSIGQTYSGAKLDTREVFGSLRNWYIKAHWYEIYDLIEFVSECSNIFTNKFNEKVNEVLEREMSGYRIVSGRVVRIISDEEISEIEQAINETSEWSSVNTHLKSALKFISDKKGADYRNSIKESISAVESLCGIITNVQGGTLGNLVNEMARTHGLNKSLGKSISALYGFASEHAGIRHGLNENSDHVGFDEAKFIFVTCSSMINYLKLVYLPK